MSVLDVLCALVNQCAVYHSPLHLLPVFLPSKGRMPGPSCCVSLLGPSVVVEREDKLLLRRQSSSTRASQSENHSYSRHMLQLEDSEYGVLDCEFGFRSHEWKPFPYSTPIISSKSIVATSTAIEKYAPPAPPHTHSHQCFQGTESIQMTS